MHATLLVTEEYQRELEAGVGESTLPWVLHGMIALDGA
jgi:hypothetical protein